MGVAGLLEASGQCETWQEARRPDKEEMTSSKHLQFVSRGILLGNINLALSNPNLFFFSFQLRSFFFSQWVGT